MEGRSVRRVARAKIKQPRRGFTAFFEVGGGRVFFRNRERKGGSFDAHPVPFSRGCGDPDGCEGLFRTRLGEPIAHDRNRQ
jgi:hypothetical protein